MSEFTFFLLLLPILCVLILISTVAKIKIDWNIPIYKKIFIVTMIVLALSFSVRAFIIYDTGNYDEILSLMFVDNFLTLSVIPLLYWFVESITIEKKRFSLLNFVQFLPAMVIGGVVLALGCILRQTLSAEELCEMQWDNDAEMSIQWWFCFCNTTLIDIMLVIQIAYTAVAAIIYIDRFRRDAKKYYSELCESGYRHFLWILILIVLIVILYSTKIFARRYITYGPCLVIFFSLACSIVVAHLFYCINKIDFAADKVTEAKESMDIEEYTTHEQISEMLSELKEISNALDAWSKNPSKPYLKQGISLEDLSKEIGYSCKNVSTYLNKIESQSFFIFIARLRVNEAKRLLLDPANYSLTYIALECGFSDAPNFSRSFKNIEGMTPGAWRLLHQK